MKCPIDQTEMKKGYIVMKAGVSWVSEDRKGDLFVGNLMGYKCPKCAKLELKVEEEE